MTINTMDIRRKCRVKSNERLTHKTMLMNLECDDPNIKAPGQFINIAIEGKYLKRPISVSNYCNDPGIITILYDIVGEGTEILSRKKPGDSLEILTALGNGFSNPETHGRPILLGGGIGCAPLMSLALDCKIAGKNPILVLGFNTKEDVIRYEDLYAALVECHYSTVDGSYGTKGFVTDVIREKNLSADYFYACGPMPMLKAICNTLEIPGEVSLESRMGCGFGICMCCSVECKDGAKRICKDGPVFRKEELIWK